MVVIRSAWELVSVVVFHLWVESVFKRLVPAEVTDISESVGVTLQPVSGQKLLMEVQEKFTAVIVVQVHVLAHPVREILEVINFPLKNE